jgi:hypothetical protein
MVSWESAALVTLYVGDGRMTDGLSRRLPTELITAILVKFPGREAPSLALRLVKRSLKSDRLLSTPSWG